MSLLPYSSSSNHLSFNQPIKIPQRNTPTAYPEAKSGQTANTQDPDYSIWRNTALRYGGYFDEIGEFLRPYLGSVGTFLGYGISSAYVAADMLTSLPQKYKNAPPAMSQNEKLIKTAKEAVDLSVFHLVATLLVPPMLIGAVVKTTGTLLHPPSSKSTPHPEPTGFSPMRAIDKCRDCIEDGLEKITTPIAPHTQQWSDRLINRLHHQFIGESGNAKANRWISRNNRTLSQLVNPVAKTAQFLSKMPIAKWFVSRELADELSGNAKAIALKTSFNLENKELAHLLFLKPIPVLVGVGMVPLIAHPFDELMLKVQNWTLRPLLGKNKLIRDSHGHLQSIRNKAFWGKPESEKRQNIGTGNLPGPSSPANLLTPSVASLAAMSKRQTPAIYGPSFLPPSYYSSRIASTPPILPYPIPASSPESRLRHMPPPFGPTNVFIPSALTSQKWALN